MADIYLQEADEKREAIARAVVDSVMQQLGEIEDVMLANGNPSVFLKIFFPREYCDDCKKKVTGYSVVHKYHFTKDHQQKSEETFTKCKSCGKL